MGKVSPPLQPPPSHHHPLTYPQIRLRLQRTSLPPHETMALQRPLHSPLPLPHRLPSTTLLQNDHPRLHRHLLRHRLRPPPHPRQLFHHRLVQRLRRQILHGILARLFGFSRRLLRRRQRRPRRPPPPSRRKGLFVQSARELHVDAAVRCFLWRAEFPFESGAVGAYVQY